MTTATAVTLLAYVDEAQLFDRRGLIIISGLVVLALLPVWLRDRRRHRPPKDPRP